jgi:Flp pilus assembly protein TadG
MRTRKSAQRGATLIEFVMVAFMLVIVIFASIEFDRMILVYTTVANSAKCGVRYAIVHGSHRSGGSGADGASGAVDPSQVRTVIKKFASAGTLNTALLDDTHVSVQYLDSLNPTDPGNTIGSRVSITVTYPYDPFVALPLHVNISSSAQGIIVY